jgi:argininosuccinate lyase
MNDCHDIVAYAVENMEVTQNVMDNPLYKLAFTVEEVNHLVSEGVPFRDAYRQVGMAVQRGEFEYHGTLNHTHEGSIGNLCTAEIRQKFEAALSSFSFDRVHAAVNRLTAM